MKGYARQDGWSASALGLSWIVYAVCQGDALLPLLAAGLVGLSLIRGAPGPPSAGRRISWRLLIALSLGLGGSWRMVVPPPPEAVPVVPVLLPAVQSALIVAAVLVWWDRRDALRGVVLRALPWATTAAAIDIPFDKTAGAAFGIFLTVVGGGILLRGARIGRDTGLPRWRRWLWVVGIFGMTIGAFAALVRAVRIGDAALTRLIRDYVLGSSDLFFKGKLQVGGAGPGGLSQRPVLAVRGVSGRLYLAGEVFERYEDGTWSSAERERRPVVPVPADTAGAAEIVMYDPLGGVVPLPRESSPLADPRGRYERDTAGIVYSVGRRIPRVRFVSGVRAGLRPTDEDTDDLLRLSPILAERLPRYARAIVGAERDPARIALLIEMFFRRWFTYDLHPGFLADDMGILFMLEHRRPAYCTYFASAMALLLRTEGIPSRVVGGFLVTPGLDWQKDQNRFLVRGRDAHSWVEALLPDGRGGRRWVRFDPTPAASRELLLRSRYRPNPLADALWCGVSRLRAAFLDMDGRTLGGILAFGVLLVAIEEGIRRFVLRLRTRQRGHVRLTKKVSPHLEACRRTYRRFEADVRRRGCPGRRETETAAEWLARVRRTDGVPSEFADRIEAFLGAFHAARFGTSSAVPSWDGGLRVRRRVS